MEKINVLIVEDSGLIAEDIAVKLRKHNMNIAGIFASGEEAIQSLNRVVPDLILMDIQLAGALDGISAAQVIGQNFQIPIIYLSDHTDKNLVDRAKKTFPANYLSKPFNEVELVRALEIAFANVQVKQPYGSVLQNHIFIKDGTSYIKIAYHDIVCLKAERAYCTIVTENKHYLQSTNMSGVLSQLNHPDFIQVHRSFVVNITKITAIHGNMIQLGKIKAEMSKSKREELIGRLQFLK